MSIYGPNIKKLTHASLLRILPFSCGYLCDVESGKPDGASVTIAMMLQAAIAVGDPFADLKDYDN